MSTSNGATDVEWAWFACGLGLTADLLPVLQDSNAPISARSKIADPGKVPSVYNRARELVGFSSWTKHTASDADVAAWSAEPNYGICVQTRRVRALDVDVDDVALAAEIEAVIVAGFAGAGDARRSRANSPRFLVAFEMPGEFKKRVITTRAGRIEFLGDGQQFVACGTHPRGERYEWRGDLPTLSTFDRAAFELLWSELQKRFGVGKASKPAATSSSPDWVENARRNKFAREDTWFEPLSDEQKLAEAHAIASTWTAEDATDRDTWLKNIRTIGDAEDRGLDAEAALDIAEEFSQRTTSNNCASRDEIDAKMHEGGDKPSIYAAATIARRSGYVLPRERFVPPPPPPPTVPSGTVSAPFVPPPPPALPMAAPPGTHALTMNRKAQFDATLENLNVVLSTQGIATLGYDEFRERVMVAPAGTIEYRPITDTDEIHFRETLGRAQRFAPIGKEIMRDSLRLVAERFKFDTAQMWLNSLVWDNVPRVDRFLADYCGAADDDYARAVSRYVWSGLAGRVLEPGCQLDMVVALQSPQGKQKSTGLQSMVPDPEFFTDGLSLHQDDDNFKRLIRGKLVVEIAELAGLSRADINVVKRAITRKHEEWVEKFEKHETRYSRRCMLFATTNDERFLPPDETGNRRWLPVEIERLSRERIAADRDQLWAEGAAIFRDGGIAWREAERLAEGRHANYEARDVWEAEIDSWLNAPTPPVKMGKVPGPPPKTRPFAISEVLGALGMQTSQMDAKAEKRAARVLRQLKYEDKTVRVDGRVKRRWVPAGSL